MNFKIRWKSETTKSLTFCNGYLVNNFIDRKVLSSDFFIFHPKREAIAHGRMAIDTVFPLWAPNCHLGEWQFGSFFVKSPRLQNEECRFYRHFGGVGREKAPHVCFPCPHRPTLPRQLPPLIERNMYRFFTCVDLSIVCLPTVPIRGHGSLMRHEKAPAITGRGKLLMKRCRQTINHSTANS